MHKNKELKRISRENLTGQYKIPMGAFVIAGVITLAIELPFYMLRSNNSSIIQTIIFYTAEFLISLISTVLTVGLYSIHLNMARKKSYDLFQLFYGFKNHPDRFLIAGFFMMLLSAAAMIPSLIGFALWYNTAGGIYTALFILLGIISLILYVYMRLFLSLLYFVIIDHAQMTVPDAFKFSFGLMKGRLGRIFAIYLSFLGLNILSLLSLGIGSLWVNPYQFQTLANFYLDATGELPDPVHEQAQASGQQYDSKEEFYYE